MLRVYKMDNIFRRTCQTTLAVLVCFILVDFSQQTTIKIGVLMTTESTFAVDMRKAVPALSIAFEEAQRRFGIDFDVVYKNYTETCPVDTGVGHLAELYYVDHVKAVLGPACSSTLQTAGRLAQYLKLPVVSGMGDLVLRDPAINDMLTTTTILSYNLKKLDCKYKVDSQFCEITGA